MDKKIKPMEQNLMQNSYIENKSMPVPRFGWTSDGAEQSHSYLLPATIRLLKKHDVQSLLDIGTGNGSNIPAWQASNIRVAAMEPDEEGFNFARQYKGADVRKFGVGEPIPTEWEEAFDAVISLEVVEHLFDPIELVKTSKQTLKKGGIAIISTPYHGYWKNLALALADKWDHHHHPIKTGGHIKFWTRRSLSDLFTNQGFKEVSFEGVGRLPYLWKSMIMVFRLD